MIRSDVGHGIRGLLIAALTIGSMLAAPSLASAADITVNDDGVGPGPPGANCAAPDHATINAAIAAAAASGDRILVCAGTYTQTQVLINKSVQLIGAGADQAIIDGGNAVAVPSVGSVRTDAAAAGNILIQGFTVRNAGETGGSRYFFGLKGTTASATIEINQVEIEGLGAGGKDYGIYADNTANDVVIRNSSITNTDFNPILLEQTDGDTVRNNVISQNGTTNTSAIFVMNYSGDNATRALRINNNEIDGNNRSGVSIVTGLFGAGATRNTVEISGNEISDFSGLAISVNNADPLASGLAGKISNVGIDRNQITPNAGAASSTGIRVQGLVSNVGIDSNDLDGLATNGIAINNAAPGHGPVGVDVYFNRVNSAAGGLTSAATAPVDAENNWWGCNEGPGQPGCVNVTGNVDSDPWLVLGLDASPTSIPASGGSATLTADLTANSSGADVGGRFPGGVPIDFGTTLGVVQTPIGSADGEAVSTLTADTAAAGTANVNADLDGESATAAVTITPLPPPPAPDAPPSIGLTVQDKVKAGERALLTATATDDIGITEVNFFAGPKNVCQVLTPPYECRFRPRRGRGRVGITAIATDTAGQTATALGSTRVIRKKHNKHGK